MTPTIAALMLALASTAASFLLKRGRADAACADDGLGPFPSVDPSLVAAIRGVTAGAPAVDRAGSGAVAVGPVHQGTRGGCNPESRSARAPDFSNFALGA